ncbi:fkbM_fam, methyltransferase, FkbM family [Candidatus Methylopumilus planktonicus]|uniref:FkbM family methyltransferase n=1 Tax=Candidatus Methylopumilus planktonicus TaxID=1581557 RepID=UPI003BEECE81
MKIFYAQYDEDKILNKIFKNRKNGICAEVGGFDGLTGSNTMFFENIGWSCLIVEPMPEFCKKIKILRKCIVAQYAASTGEGSADFYIAEGVETLSTMEHSDAHFLRINSTPGSNLRKISVKTKRLDDILIEHGFDSIDFITIDVEGHEISVLNGLDFKKIKIKILIIEDNSNGFDRSVKNLMALNGYRRFKKTGCNDWYTNDPDIYSSLDVLYTEIKIISFLLKQRIKPFVPSFLRRKV